MDSSAKFVRKTVLLGAKQIFDLEDCCLIAVNRESNFRPRYSKYAQCCTMSNMGEHRIFSMAFAGVYPYYVQKAEKKDRSKEEVDTIICWLTGYDQKGLQKQIDKEVDFKTFFKEAPKMNPNAKKITGTVCGCRIEDIEDKLMKQIRYLDKMIDELAKGKAMEKILRT